VLRELVELKSEKTRTFQVMLLDNDASNQVEVHEEREISIPRIQEHLKRGGSVFITSKPSQKIELPTMRDKVQQRRRATKTVTAFYFDHV
jgi:hypothetical protein